MKKIFSILGIAVFLVILDLNFNYEITQTTKTSSSETTKKLVIDLNLKTLLKKIPE